VLPAVPARPSAAAPLAVPIRGRAGYTVRPLVAPVDRLELVRRGSKPYPPGDPARLRDVHAHADPPQSARDRAFERLYRRYVADVYRYSLAVLRNPADAEDITQTTFLNAYRAFRRGEEPRKPQHWLIKIAHNACRTRYLRASRRPNEVPLEDSLHELAVPQDEIPNVKAILDALAKLPFNQRAALVMRELEGRSYSDIAGTLGVTVPAVETLIFRARRALRVRRSTFRSLATLPIPTSLSSFSAGGAAVGGGAIVGSGIVLKAVLAVGAGVVAGTAGPAVEARILNSRDAVELSAPALTVASGAARTPAVARGHASIVVEGARGAITGATIRAPGEDAAAALPRRSEPTKSPGAARASGQVAPTAGSSTPPESAPLPSPAAPNPAAAVTTTVAKTVPASAPAVPLPSAQTPAVPAAPDVPAVPAPVNPPSLPPPPLPPPPSLP
jgi:RNA polymerase sigma factor (sigma-70 family)